MSLFFIGLIMIVFAAFFHVYRYGMNEAKKAPPPPPVPISEEKPKELGEPQAADTAKLPEGEQGKEKPKEIAQKVPSGKKADLGFNPNKEQNINSFGLNKDQDLGPSDLGKL